MSTMNTTEIDQPVDWHAELRAEVARYIRAGLNPDSAKVAAVDAIDLRRDIAGQSLSFMTTPAEPTFDVDGLPTGMTEATYEATRFPVDDHGRIEPTWTAGGDR